MYADEEYADEEEAEGEEEEEGGEHEEWGYAHRRVGGGVPDDEYDATGDIHEIDRRLNALQHFLSGAKTTR